MVKNTYLKRFLKSTVFKGVTLLNRVIPKEDKYILLYSSNKGLWNNLKALKKYLLENKYDDKYKIIAGIEDMQYADKEDLDRILYVTRMKAYFYFLKAKHVFYTAGQIPIKPSKKQIVIHMDHGAANFKKCGAMSNINNGDEYFFTYYLAPSPIYIPIIKKSYLCKDENIKICGEASTDIMFADYKKYDLDEYSKTILWTPTFRQSDYFGYDDSTEELLPMFTEKDYNELNQHLKELDFKLIVKLHPGQDLNDYHKLNYSNLDILSDIEFVKRGYDLYELMPQIDYMIGDYSSTFLQFLLLDKPMAFVVPDFEEYSEKRGFVFENPKDYMPGELITTKKEFYALLKKWSENKDDYREMRREVKDKIHTYQDGENSLRVLKISNINLE